MNVVSDLITWARSIWAAPGTFEKVLLVFFPLSAVWDLLHGNWFHLIMAVAVTAWVIYDVQEDATNGRD